MSVKIYLSNGKHYSVSTNTLINDEEFENEEEILDYILSTYRTYEVFKIESKISCKTTFIMTNKICSIETE